MSTARAAAGAAKTSEQYLTFMLAGEEYGVDILRVQEIKGWDKATRIPHTPDYVLGVVNLRGALVPVLDLRRRFNLESIAIGPTTVIVVVRAAGERTVGMVVDAVSDVYNVDAAAIQPPPEVCGSGGTAFIKSLATIGEKMLILLDIDRLIADSIADDRVTGVAA